MTVITKVADLQRFVLAEQQRPLWLVGFNKNGNSIIRYLYYGMQVKVAGIVSQAHVEQYVSFADCDVSAKLADIPVNARVLVTLDDPMDAEKVVHELERQGFGLADISQIELPEPQDFSDEPTVYQGTSIGIHSYGAKSLIDRAGYMIQRIGAFCSINEFVFAGANHSTDYVTSNMFLYVDGLPSLDILDGRQIDKLTEKYQQYPGVVPAERVAKNEKIVIGNDVWIGTNVTIVPGVTLGDGCVIGAGAVVTKSVPPYAIVVGNPGHVLRYRIDEALITKMEQIAWWEWPLANIKANVELFYQPQKFVETFYH